ncbi:MAG: hypothetical protein KKF56_05775 [Nanoarchaeota archaeon]|nr:hypothetical protein [Nanoarchaeota archaeon]
MNTRETDHQKEKDEKRSAEPSDAAQAYYDHCIQGARNHRVCGWRAELARLNYPPTK